MVPVSSTLMDDPYLVCSSVASWGGGGGGMELHTHTHFYFDGRPLSGMLTASSWGGGGYGLLMTINVILEVLLW